MKTFHRTIGGMKVSGKFSSSLVWHLLLIFQFGMKVFEQNWMGCKSFQQFLKSKPALAPRVIND